MTREYSEARKQANSETEEKKKENTLCHYIEVCIVILPHYPIVWELILSRKLTGLLIAKRPCFFSIGENVSRETILQGCRVGVNKQPCRPVFLSTCNPASFYYSKPKTNNYHFISGNDIMTS